MNKDLIESIEQNIKDAKGIVQRGNALERLLNNRDFKEVIQKGYFQDEAIRLVHLKSDANFQTPERQQLVLSQMDAIGTLNQYFDTVMHAARMAAKAIDADEEARDEILAEELNNG